jgi:hypothetical protein
MKSLRNIAIAVMIIIPVVSAGQAQNSKEVNMGLTVAIQQGQVAIMVPLFLSDKVVLAPAFEFASASKVGTDIVFGVLAKTFFNHQGELRPYWGIRAGIGYFNSKAPDTSNQTDYIVGAAIGVEYFFNKNFSIGIEPQLNMSVSDDESDRFGNPGGTNINTGTMLTANIYF